jgi:hypothetical protein
VQLRLSGEQARICLIDPPAPRRPGLPWLRDDGWYVRWRFGHRTVLEAERFRRCGGEEAAFDLLLDDMARTGSYSRHLRGCSRAEAKRRLSVERACIEASTRYSPRPFDGEALIVAQHARIAARAPDDLGAWEALIAGPLTVCGVGGDHNGCLLPPVVDEAAAALGGWLQD